MSLPAVPAALAGKASFLGYGVGRLGAGYTIDVSGMAPRDLDKLVERSREVRFLWELRTRQLVLSFTVDRASKVVQIGIIPRVLNPPPSPEDAARALTESIRDTPLLRRRPRTK